METLVTSNKPNPASALSFCTILARSIKLTVLQESLNGNAVTLKQSFPCSLPVSPLSFVTHISPIDYALNSILPTDSTENNTHLEASFPSTLG